MREPSKKRVPGFGLVCAARRPRRKRALAELLPLGSSRLRRGEMPPLSSPLGPPHHVHSTDGRRSPFTQKAKWMNLIALMQAWEMCSPFISQEQKRTPKQLLHRAR
ncbi:hypothetical protein AAFF_G00107330 [Aldrovandia affinis]|uniref:Uncharacterized protein n=1 Tax=Aldrovandia affinis TaxID=143900 RepID=A0AAD7RTZ6_9TELE|nr:hypothetical protein AAFF_G00107330 [Aldrovandia affinis]